MISRGLKDHLPVTVTVFVLGTQLAAGAVTVSAGGAGAVTVTAGGAGAVTVTAGGAGAVTVAAGGAGAVTVVGIQLEAAAVETTVVGTVLGAWLIVVVAAVV